jgi:hypothetical protein
LEDPRKTGLKNGLRQLTKNQIKKVIEYPNEMVLDTFNYEDGKFCPLAVAVGLEDMQEPSHEKVFDKLTEMGYLVYNTRGILGEFYTVNRKHDLLEAANEVLKEKMMSERITKIITVDRKEDSASVAEKFAAILNEFGIQCVNTTPDSEESHVYQIDIDVETMEFDPEEHQHHHHEGCTHDHDHDHGKH